EALLTYLRQRNGIYGPLTVPYADQVRAQNIADWYQFVTVIDSFVSDSSRLGADHTAAREVFAAVMADVGPDGHGSTDGTATTAYGRAALDLWRRIGPGMSRRQVARLVRSLDAFLRGCGTEIQAKL